MLWRRIQRNVCFPNENPTLTCEPAEKGPEGSESWHGDDARSVNDSEYYEGLCLPLDHNFPYNSKVQHASQFRCYARQKLPLPQRGVKFAPSSGLPLYAVNVIVLPSYFPTCVLTFNSTLGCSRSETLLCRCILWLNEIIQHVAKWSARRRFIPTDSYTHFVN
jgi:hypothetical protein